MEASRHGLVALVMFGALVWGVNAIENKCSACIAVQNELVEVLLEEKPKANLDLRNRLNTKGKREGKVIDYKDSELRIMDILENLCARMKKYSILILKDSKKRIWMHGQTQATDRLKLIAEEQGKELKRWCDRMLEMHEDEMAEMIREETKTAYKELPIILCRNITKNCKDEEAYLKEVKRMAPHLPTSEGKTPKIPGIEVKEATGSDEAAGDGSTGGDDSQGESPAADDEAKVEL